MGDVEERIPLLQGRDEAEQEDVTGGDQLWRRVWGESKKLWRIVGPTIVSRVASYSMDVITQAFAGHLGNLELASMSIANTVVVGFNFGFMLGMASALETLCGQAFGAKKHHTLGVYLQRSWIILFFCAVLLLPMYLFTTPILELLGQPPELATHAGTVSMWFIPLHFAMVFVLPLQRFLQSQLKASVNALMCTIALIIHIITSWLFVYQFKLGLIGIALALDYSWWLIAFLLFGYVSLGGCPLSWNGFSMEAFAGLWEFFKLSAASGVMLCLENWYYRILILLTGKLKNAEIAMDALSICMSINGWEIMIPFAFLAGTGVRVANELGAGNGKGARFASIVSVINSFIVGLFFCVLVMVLRDKVALFFTSSAAVLDAVNNLSLLLALTILLNSVQPVLSGVAVGSGWQAMVAYVNIGSYYLIGIPIGIFMGWIFNLGVLGIWGGMIGGTAIQTMILAYITIRHDWDEEAMIAITRTEKIGRLKSNQKI